MTSRAPADAPRCRQCNEPAILQVSLAAGCFVYPHDRLQWLCAQHWDRCTPLGDQPPVILQELAPWPVARRTD